MAQISGSEGRGQSNYRALFLAHLGRDEESHAHLHSVLDEYDIGSEEDGQVSILMLFELLESAGLTKDREAAALLLQRLAGLSRLSVAFGGEGAGMTSPARLLGGAAALLDKPADARAYYHLAFEVCAKIGFRPEIALTRLQLAELLLDESAKPSPFGRGKGEGNDPDALHKEALQHLDFAISEFREMKMQPSLQRALRHRGLLKA